MNAPTSPHLCINCKKVQINPEYDYCAACSNKLGTRAAQDSGHGRKFWDVALPHQYPCGFYSCYLCYEKWLQLHPDDRKRKYSDVFDDLQKIRQATPDSDSTDMRKDDPANSKPEVEAIHSLLLEWSDILGLYKFPTHTIANFEASLGAAIELSILEARYDELSHVNYQEDWFNDKGDAVMSVEERLNELRELQSNLKGKIV